LPHAPQFAGSVEVSTHALPHCSAPKPQSHSPSTQVVPKGQTLPQDPQ
jgi:hypothetical protein